MIGMIERGDARPSSAKLANVVDALVTALLEQSVDNALGATEAPRRGL